MLSSIANLSVKSITRITSRGVSQNVASRKLTNYKKSLIAGGSFGSLACFDYFGRDGESIQAAVRFLRSLKTGIEISMDYNIGLSGLDENSDNYEKVGHEN